jgi:glycosyltransferase involved in cell wall biosynthesis
VHSLDADPVLGFPLSRQVATVHDPIPWTEPARRRHVRAYLRVQRRRLQRCAAIITDSAAIRDEVIEVLDLEAARVHAIPIGVDPGFTPDPQPEDEQRLRAVGIGTAGYVLWVGSLSAHDPRKAVDTLLEAISLISDTGLRLVMVGRPGLESARVAAAARDRGIELVLPGFVSDADLAAIYRGATVVALPSLHEGFGLPALEALASGAALVTTRGGNLGLLVGEAGRFVAPGDVSELAGALREVATDEPMRQRLRAAGPPLAAAYSWRRTAEQTVEIYRRVAGHPID